MGTSNYISSYFPLFPTLEVLVNTAVVIIRQDQIDIAKAYRHDPSPVCSGESCIYRSHAAGDGDQFSPCPFQQGYSWRKTAILLKNDPRAPDKKKGPTQSAPQLRCLANWSGSKPGYVTWRDRPHRNYPTLVDNLPLPLPMRTRRLQSHRHCRTCAETTSLPTLPKPATIPSKMAKKLAPGPFVNAVSLEQLFNRSAYGILLF